MELEDKLGLGRLINVAVVGAADIVCSPDEPPPPQNALLARSLARVLAFEPQIDLAPKDTEFLTCIPWYVGDGRPASFYKCRAAPFSSLLPPDPAAFDCFPLLQDFMEVVERSRVETKPLDYLQSDFDFLVMDVQGAEDQVIIGARNKLKQCVFVQTEVRFFPIYKNQPLFADIDTMLRANGFVFHMFKTMARRLILPQQPPPDKPLACFNQVDEADVVYVRDFRRMDLMSDDQLKCMALIAYYSYQSIDLTVRCLEELKCRAKPTSPRSPASNGRASSSVAAQWPAT